MENLSACVDTSDSSSLRYVYIPHIGKNTCIVRMIVSVCVREREIKRNRNECKKLEKHESPNGRSFFCT